MKIEKAERYTTLYSDAGKLLAKIGDSQGSTMLILGKSDSAENYEEIDMPPDPKQVNLDDLKEALITQSRNSLESKMMELLQPYITQYAEQIAEEQKLIETEIMECGTEEELNIIRGRP